jgi:GTP-binding protein
VILVASATESTLAMAVRRRHLLAGSGHPGAGGRKSGRQGPDTRFQVPLGTVVTDSESGEVLADLDREGATAVVARGGVGGRGNVHFATPTLRAPRIAEPGLPGEERTVRLDLRLIADVGLVGPPNAGKSSLLAAVSNARPRIGDYPFTTLDPELGVAETGSGRFVVADIPGLLKGASTGTGLGLRFLRHLERTRVLVYVIDGATESPWEDLAAVREEVRAYSLEMAARPSLVAVNKIDLPAAAALRGRTRKRDVLFVSAVTGEGVRELVGAIEKLLASAPKPEPATAAVMHRLKRTPAPNKVERRPWGFEVSGERIERLLRRTDLDLPDSLARFQAQLDRTGVSRALEEAGAQPGDTVRIGDREFEYQP